jgi:hypothetical protein
MEQALRDVDHELSDMIVQLGMKRRERDELIKEAVREPYELNRRRVELLMPRTGRATIYAVTRGQGRYG